MALSKRTLERERNLCQELLRRDDLPEPERRELYGAFCALSWALGDDVMKASKAATFGVDWHYGLDGREVKLTLTHS